jgi:outer membrane protein OmpA-like peptidoglycan-associated protein
MFQSSRRFPVLAVAAVLGLAGCADGTQPGRGTAIGAGTGAVVGGVLGNVLGASGARTEATAIGAAVGAALGGGVGFAMDRQRQDFENQLAAEQARNDVQIRQLREDVLLLTLDSEIQFATGSATVQPGLRDTLRRIADVLNRYPGSQVAVIGHTASTGSLEFNQRLSEARANSVRNELIAFGVRADSLVAVGRGPTEPIADNATAAGRAANRRVDLVVTRPT